ncbi:unnamed protein product [Peniophora sp. CBMAI 1063]|nr:unnamed protein product [Peniophora sp. CBMAI 1063]
MENSKASTNDSGGIRRQSSALGDEESVQEGRETPASMIVLSDPSSADGGELQGEADGSGRVEDRLSFPPSLAALLGLTHYSNANSDPEVRAFVKEHFPHDFDPVLELSRIRNAASDAEARAITREHFSRLGPHSVWRSMMLKQEAALDAEAELLERLEVLRRLQGANRSDGEPSHAAGHADGQEEQE